MVSCDDIKQWLEMGLSDSEIKVIGDDGHHFEALVISPHFEGKKELQRHRMVYAVLGDKMKQEIHALSLKTLTPQEQTK